MDEEQISRAIRKIDSEIVDSYNPEKKQVMLNINIALFNQIASQIDN